MVRVLFLSSQWHGTAKRFILSSSVSDEFVDRFRQRLAALKMGDPLDESTGVAPLSSVDAAARLDDQVNRSVAGGARVILGGKRPSADSAFFEPTILTNVEKGTPAYDEERAPPLLPLRAQGPRQGRLALVPSSSSSPARLVIKWVS